MFWTLLIFTLGLSPYQRSNAEIQRLVELLKTVILNDCAASTVSSYAGAANRWIDWCKCYSFPPLQSNPTAVALYLTSLSDRGLSRSFGLHSLRSGGASQAARSGVCGRVWRRHGGWRSIQAAYGYVDESLENTLMVSRNLAL